VAVKLRYFFKGDEDKFPVRASTNKTLEPCAQAPSCYKELPRTNKSPTSPWSRHSSMRSSPETILHIVGELSLLRRLWVLAMGQVLLLFQRSAHKI
jgi:hypothetical protein